MPKAKPSKPATRRRRGPAPRNASPRAVMLRPDAALTIGEVISVARGLTAGPREPRRDDAALRAPVTLGRSVRPAMTASRAVVERCLRDGGAHYGINTGFGSLAKQRISPDDLAALQRNLVRSHAAGVGEPMRDELVRAMMLVLAASLARGKSGVRPVVVETLVAALNADVVPVVPSVGSVGASGDLAPLAHVALAMTGEGDVRLKGGAPMPAATALRQAGITPLTLQAKEGLALINGTHLMAAEGALLMWDVRALMQWAVLATAMSIDACRASHAFLDSRLYAARRQWGPWFIAAEIRQALDGGTIAESHRENDPRVQDPYSLRAAPTVLGACREAIDHAVIDRIHAELGAVTDNPLVFRASAAAGPVDPADVDGPVTLRPDPADLRRGEGVVSGANFHGMPLALPLDYLAIALTHVAGISERRTYLMTGAFEPESHLKPFLAPRPGLQSGLMIAQYTAAACVNEMIGLCTPASVANIPTCAGMEDYNSFGPRSAAKARRCVELAQRVVAIELLCAASGVETHRPLRSGDEVERGIALVRARVPPLTDDRPLTADIEAVADMIDQIVLDADGM